MSTLLDKHKAAVADLKDCIATAQKAANAPLRVGVMGYTGWGDMAVQLAACAALRSAVPEAHVMAVLHFSGAMVETDMAAHAKKCGMVDDYVLVHQLVEQLRRPLLHELAPCFDVLYDVATPAARTICNPDTTDGYAVAQAEANARLAAYGDLYSGWPSTGWRVKTMRESRWDILSYTLGVEVSPQDLVAPLACAPFPTHVVNGGPAEMERLAKRAMSDKWESAALPKDVKRYVVMNNCCGRGGGTKIMPDPVVEAIVTALNKRDVRVVQIGRFDEKQIPFAIDRRGFRVPIGVRLLQGALTGIFIEGFWAYMGGGLGKPCCVMFGPTPVNFYGIPCHHNIINGHVDEQGRIALACPRGSCFQEAGDNWADHCPLMGYKFPNGKAVNPVAPYCGNFDEPKVAAAKILKVVEGLLEARA